MRGVRPLSGLFPNQGRITGPQQPDLTEYRPVKHHTDQKAGNRLIVAACQAHLRRGFRDLWQSARSGIACDALSRIGALCDIAGDITGQTASARHAARQALIWPRA